MADLEAIQFSANNSLLVKDSRNSSIIKIIPNNISDNFCLKIINQKWSGFQLSAVKVNLPPSWPKAEISRFGRIWHKNLQGENVSW